jgi:hypothetical protein
MDRAFHAGAHRISFVPKVEAAAFATRRNPRLSARNWSTIAAVVL